MTHKGSPCLLGGCSPHKLLQELSAESGVINKPRRPLAGAAGAPGPTKLPCLPHAAHSLCSLLGMLRHSHGGEGLHGWCGCKRGKDQRTRNCTCVNRGAALHARSLGLCPEATHANLQHPWVQVVQQGPGCPGKAEPMLSVSFALTRCKLAGCSLGPLRSGGNRGSSICRGECEGREGAQ